MFSGRKNKFYNKPPPKHPHSKSEMVRLRRPLAYGNIVAVERAECFRVYFFLYYFKSRVRQTVKISGNVREHRCGSARVFLFSVLS